MKTICGRLDIMKEAPGNNISSSEIIRATGCKIQALKMQMNSRFAGWLIYDCHWEFNINTHLYAADWLDFKNCSGPVSHVDEPAVLLLWVFFPSTDSAKQQKPNLKNLVR